MSPVTTVQRTLRLLIHERATTIPGPGTVEFTLAHSRFGAIPSFGGQIVRPTEGRTESQPYWVDIVDKDEEFTAVLAVSGRMAMLGRLVELQVDTDGGGFVTVDQRRLSSIEGGSEGAFRLELSDERWIERRHRIFEKTTSWQFHPYGQSVAWMGRSAAGDDGWYVDRVGTDYVILSLLAGSAGVDAQVVDVLRGDLLRDPTITAGAFDALRFENTGGADRIVLRFDPDPSAIAAQGVASQLTDHVGPIGPFLRGAQEGGPFFQSVLVYWPGHGLSAGTTVRGRLYWPGGIDTTEGTPYLLGGTAGIRAPDLYQEIAAGDHGGPAQQVETAAFTALSGDTYPRAWYRIREPKERDRWIEDNLCKPYTVVPFTADGKLAPKSMRPPQDIDPDTLYEFDASNVVDAVVWRHPGREAVTAVDFRARFRLPLFNLTAPFRRQKQYDTVALLGFREAALDLDAIFRFQDLGGVFDGFTQDLFERFGDAPQRWEGLAQIEATSPASGDLVVLNMDALRCPNAATDARSGKRVVHALERLRVYEGARAFYAYKWLDAGPNNQPLATPSVSVSQTTGAEKHSVDVQVSSVPAGASAIVQVAHGANPQAADWFTARTGIGNETITIGQRPSGTQINVRAIATAPNRIRSAASAVDSVTTQSLTAPSTVTATAFGRSVKVVPTLGELGYPVEYLIDGVPQITLPAGSSQHTFHALAPGTQFTFGVRHRDLYGGVSTTTTDTETTGLALLCPDMAGMSGHAALIVEDPVRRPVPLEDPFVDVAGVVAILRLLAGDPAFDIVIESSADVSGSPQLTASMLSHSGLSAFNAAAIVDRTLETSQGWHTDSATAGAWLKVDLGAGRARAMTALGVYALSAGYPGVYDIQYSDNDVDWTTVVQDFGPSLQGWNRVRWAGAGAHRYWRLLLDNTPGAGSWLTELDLSDGAFAARVAGDTKVRRIERPSDGAIVWFRGWHARDGWQDGLPLPWFAVDFAEVEPADENPGSVGDKDIVRLRRITPFDDGKYAPRGESDGNLADGVLKYEGSQVHALARHVENPNWGRDGDSKTFAQAYQNAPTMVLAGLKVRHPDGARDVLRVYTVNVSETGFDIVAKNVDPGATTAQGDDFPAGNLLDAEGETAELTLGAAPSNDDSYVGHHSVELTVHAAQGGPGVTITVVVAIDTDTPGTGSWVERTTKQYSHTQAGWTTVDPGADTLVFSHEARDFNVSGLTTSSKVRHRIKSVVITGAGTAGVEVHAFNLATDGDPTEGVTYVTATDDAVSATPNTEDGVLFVPVEAA